MHRFDILTSGGVNYLIACALKSGHEYKDDWSSPGIIWVCELPEDLSAINEGNQLSMKALKEGLLKNHGYCRVEEADGMWAAVAAENGIFKVVPPAGRGGDWSVETLTEDAASDMTFASLHPLHSSAHWPVPHPRPVPPSHSRFHRTCRPKACPAGMDKGGASRACEDHV